MVSLITLPQTVRSKAAQNSEKLQAKFRVRLHAMQALARAGRGRLNTEAERLAAALTAEHGGGFSKKNLLNLYRDFRRHGANALLFAYGAKAEKPEEFVRELARRAGNNNRVASVELENIRADWFAGREVKGYGTWRECWQKKFAAEPMPETCPVWFAPSGFSTRTLRRYLPGKTHLTLARDGYFAAHGRLPQKPNDYSALRPLELVVFDDVRMDFLVSYPGCKQPVEMWLLVAMDVATRCILDWVSLAAVPGEDGKRESLLEDHMRVLVGNIIHLYGVPSGWRMTLKVENAKATLRGHDMQALRAIAGEQIAVEHTRMVTRNLPGGRAERHGSPWEKGMLESFFKTLHNHAAALPGQTGARYDLAPADLDARKKEHADLVKAADGLPPAVLEQLRLPFLTYAQAVAALQELFAALNARTAHSLQGFDRVEVFRLPEDNAWRPIAELARYPQAEIRRALIESRMESPRERMEKLLRAAPPFVRVPEDALVMFHARLIKRVSNPAPYTVRWTEQGTRFEYRGEIEALRAGAGGPFSVRVLPGNMTSAWLYDATTGAQLGRIERVNTPRIGDETAQKRALGEVQHYRSLITREVNATHAPDRADKDEAAALNAAILAAGRTGRSMVEDAAEGRRIAEKQNAETRRHNARLGAILADQARKQQEAAADF